MTHINWPRLGFGTSRVGGGTQSGSPKETLSILQRAIDRGIRFFDTADIYAQGQSETLLGQVISSQRDDVVIATKGGYRFTATAGALAKLKPLIRGFIRSRPGLGKSVKRFRASQLHQDFSQRHLVSALEASLRRLRTEYIDLYQLHSPPEEIIRRAEIFDVMKSLQKAGKIRYFGVACLEPEHALLCLPHGVSSVQIEVNFLGSDILKRVLPAADAAGVAVIARQIFASALLIKDSSSWSVEDFRGNRGAMQRAQELIKKLKPFGSLSELSLRFWLQHPLVTCTLFGTTNPSHFESNMAAADLGDLDPPVFQGVLDILRSTF
jgi:aryl-alcohol dehydrogenase-like predicted oxidoreductase